MTTYRSKPGPALIIPLVVIMGSTTFIMAYNKIWAGLVLMLAILAFILHVFLTTYYQVGGTFLKIKCGYLFSKTIGIETITKISETNNPLSAPATSLDRLEISYNKYDKIMISPRDKQGFIQHLTNLKPDIEIHYKTTSKNGNAR